MTVIDRRYSVAEGQAIKSPCVAATTATITLAGLQTIDGVSLAENDRVLVKDQSIASQNGIYAASSGNWSRTRDFDGTYDVVHGSLVWVHSGSMNGSMMFFVTTLDPITIDSSSIAFSTLEVLLNAAPGNADYLTKTATSSLSAERVVTDTTSVVWDWSTPAQAKATVPAATTSLSGISELATSAEAITGTDTVRTVTPAALAATIASVSPALPRGYIDGCILSNNVSDATNDTDFSAGVCRDITNAFNITCSALTKRLDANWAAGTNQGGRDSSASITNTTYHWYAVSKADGTQDYYATTATTEATALSALHGESGGSSYIYARRIGSIIRASAAIKAFSQLGDEFLLTTAVMDINAGSIGTTASLITITVPLGIKVRALFAAGEANGSSSLLVTSPDETDQSVGATGPFSTGNLSAGTGAGAPHWPLRTNTSGQVRVRASGTVTYYFVTRGWIDARGKDN